MSKLIDLMRNEEKKERKDFKVVVDSEKLEKVDPDLLSALMNVKVVPATKEEPKQKEGMDDLDSLFDTIVNDATTVIARKDAPEVVVEVKVESKPRAEKVKVVTDPPKTTPDQMKCVADLAVLDPNLKNETITDNILVDNSITIILEAKIKLLKKKNAQRDVIAEMEELLACMVEGNKIALTQRWQHVVSMANSRGMLEVRAFLYVIGELYFTEDKFF